MIKNTTLIQLLFILLTGTFYSASTFAKLKVIATTQNVKYLVKEVAGDHVDIEAFTKGSQDPHYLEAKPSFMFKAARADLLVSMGLDLEVGWLPAILRGARNRKIMPGNPGSLILGKHIKPLHVPHGEINRKLGDVHPAGNPHFMLDPMIAGKLALVVAEKLSELDSDHKKDYDDRAKAFRALMFQKTMQWKFKISMSKNLKVVSYHRTLSYFFNQFGITLLDSVEPKPGVAPTVSHILSLSNKMKKEKVNTILVENFFDPSAALKVKELTPGSKVVEVAVSVEGASQIKSLENLYESLVSSIVGAK